MCIPISINSEGVYRVYGHFCMPECALAYLMNEHIDSSTKYERSALLHSLYRDICTDVAIKPAPSPHYTLNRYCGNLSIEEYRSLYKNHKYVMVLSKPISGYTRDPRGQFGFRHEDQDDTHARGKGDVYTKGQSQSTPTNFVIMS